MKIKFLEKEIEVTKKFLQKASTFGTEEYTTLVKAMSDLPNFQLKVKPVKRKEQFYKVAQTSTIKTTDTSKPNVILST